MFRANGGLNAILRTRRAVHPPVPLQLAFSIGHRAEPRARDVWREWMSHQQSDGSGEYRFAVTPLPADDVRSRQLPRNMAPHPLNYQELPFEPEYFVYNGRLASGRMNNATDEETYWLVRRQVILRHTGERPIEVSGPDAEALLNLSLIHI